MRASHFAQPALRHIKPGGYIEIHELDPGFYCDDDSLPSNCSSVQWANLFAEACTKMGRPLLNLQKYKEGLSDAGFVDVEEKIFKRPSNPWPKEKKLKEIGMV